MYFIQNYLFKFIINKYFCIKYKSFFAELIYIAILVVEVSAVKQCNVEMHLLIYPHKTLQIETGNI